MKITKSENLSVGLLALFREDVKIAMSYFLQLGLTIDFILPNAKTTSIIEEQDWKVIEGFTTYIEGAHIAMAHLLTDLNQVIAKVVRTVEGGEGSDEKK